MSRNMHALGAVLLVLLSVVAPTVSVAAVSTSAETGASWVGVPDSNVSDNVPQTAQSAGFASADALNPRTTRHGETLAVSVTTEAAADGRANACRGGGQHPAFCDSPTLALNLSDSTNHAGRTVALNASAVEASLGYRPTTAEVEHSSGESYSVAVRQMTVGGQRVVVFDVREFSTNVVTFEGEVNLSSDSATDGATLTYQLENVSAASDPQGTLTGVEATEWDNVSATGLGDGETLVVNPAGDEIRGPASGDPEVVLTGEGFTRTDSASGDLSPGGSASLDVDGNLDPNGTSANGEPTLELTAHTLRETEFEASDGQDRVVVQSGHDSEHTFKNPPDSLTGFEIPNATSTGGVTLDVFVTVGETADGQYQEGTAVGSWDTSQTLSFDFNQSIDTSGATYVTVEFVAVSGSGSVQAWSDDSDEGTYYAYDSSTYNYALEVNAVSEPNNVQATASDATSASFGDMTDGETATKEFDFTEETSSFDLSADGGAFNYSADWTERAASEDPAADVDGDGIDECSVSGLLHDGETKTCAVPGLGPSDDTTTVSLSSGTVGVEVRLQEVSETRDANVTLNGEQIASVSGTLAAGDTANFSANSSLLQEGENQVNISVGDGSLSTDAPTPAVGFDMTHSATADQTVNYRGEEWSERYDVSRTWGDSGTNATLTIPFDSHVVAVRDLTVFINGTETPPAWSHFKSNSTTLEVGLGNLNANATTRVVTNATKVEASNVTLDVLEPTTTGEQLNSKIRVSNLGPDAFIGIGPTENAQNIHYLHSESWAANESVVIDASGHQRLHLPNAPDGGTARVTHLGTEASVPAGDARIRVDDSGSTTKLNVAPGPRGAGDTVRLTYYQTTTDVTYYLKELVGDEWRLVDSEKANSPVTLETDDSEQTLAIFEGSTRIEDSSTGDGDGQDGGGGSGASTVGGSLFVVVAVGLLSAVWFVSQQWGAGRISTKLYLSLAVGVIGVFGLELLSGALVEGLVSVLLRFFGGAVQYWPLIIIVLAGLYVYRSQTRNSDKSASEQVVAVVRRGDS